MEDIELLEILKKLKKVPYELQFDEVKHFPVKMLEKLAIKLYEEHISKGYRKMQILDIILSERVTKIHSNFKWINENKNKLIKINDKIIQTFEKAYNEAFSVRNELENRIKNGDDFLKDYEISIKLDFYMGDELFKDDINGNFGFVLSEPISGYSPIEYSLGHYGSHMDLDEKPIYLDKSLNWNGEYFDNAFNENYIGYAIHELLDTDQWSFMDIINIEKICADVEIKHQYFNENIE